LVLIFFIEFRESRALENVEIDLAITLSQVFGSIEETLYFVFPDIENHT
jgi:hypothetical protein